MGKSLRNNADASRDEAAFWDALQGHVDALLDLLEESGWRRHGHEIFGWINEEADERWTSHLEVPDP